jgi:L-cysteine/cystine lyase
LSIRDELPALAGVTYLNAGTNGPMPRAALEAMREELALAVERPRIGMPAFEHFLGLRDQVREALARTVAAPPEQIALTNSTTQGVGVVVAGLDWNPGDRVLTTTEEHQGIRAPLDVISSRYGVDVVEVEADLLAERIDERTRLVAVSHVLWTTGRVLDVAALAAAAHEVGAALLLDGAQSVGAIAVDAPASGADFYAFSGQKWLLGPGGSGGLWVAPDWIDRLWTAQAGYLNLVKGEVGTFKDTAARFDAGTIDTVTLTGIGASLGWVDSQPGGRAGWVERTAANADGARRRLSDQPGVELSTPDGGAGPLIALTVEGRDDPVALAEQLSEQDILVRSIPGTPLLRVSVGAWTTDEEIDRLATALTA